MAFARGRARRAFTRGFYHDSDQDYLARLALGQCAYGAGDVGEVLAALDRARTRRAWFREWGALAQRLEEQAAGAAAAGQEVSAGTAYLRASTYWATAMAGLDSSRQAKRLLTTFGAHRRCWDAFVRASRGAHVRLEVAYEDRTLPAWVLRPDATHTARPTLVMTNGSDGSVASLWGSGAAEALARGWNAVLYDGPGQQSLLFEHGIGFRPDWEAVLTPVVDAVASRPDVDATRLYCYGISQGGYWVPRALAFEHRFRAAAVDPGVVDVSSTWLGNLPASMRRTLEEGDRDRFERTMRRALRIPGLRRSLTARARPYAQDTWFDTFTEVLRYNLSEVSGDIRTPLWVSEPEGEQFWPGQSERLADLVPGSFRQPFTAAEGANLHCQPLARRLTHERMFEWFAQSG